MGLPIKQLALLPLLPANKQKLHPGISNAEVNLHKPTELVLGTSLGRLTLFSHYHLELRPSHHQLTGGIQHSGSSLSTFPKLCGALGEMCPLVFPTSLCDPSGFSSPTKKPHPETYTPKGPPCLLPGIHQKSFPPTALQHQYKHTVPPAAKKTPLSLNHFPVIYSWSLIPPRREDSGSLQQKAATP